MKYFVILLLIISAVFPKGFDYSAAMTYVFDSNIGQNYMMKSGHYIVPELKGTYWFKEVPLFIKGEFIYDYHVIERSFKENSPFLSFYVGGKLKKRKLAFKPYYSYSLYLAKTALEADTKICKEEHSITTSFFLKKKRKEIRLLSRFLCNNYGKQHELSTDRNSTNLESWFQTSVRVERTWKSKKKKLRLSALRSEIRYNYFLSKRAEDTYNSVKLEIRSKFKLFYPYIGCTMSFGKKLYHSQIENPHTGKMQDADNSNWKIEPSILVPVVSDLYLHVKGSFQKKSSQLPEDNFKRNTLSLMLSWN